MPTLNLDIYLVDQNDGDYILDENDNKIVIDTLSVRSPMEVRGQCRDGGVTA